MVDDQLRGMDSGVLPSRTYLWIRNNTQRREKPLPGAGGGGDRGSPAAATGRPGCGSRLSNYEETDNRGCEDVRKVFSQVV